MFVNVPSGNKPSKNTGEIKVHHGAPLIATLSALKTEALRIVLRIKLIKSIDNGRRIVNLHEFRYLANLFGVFRTPLISMVPLV